MKNGLKIKHIGKRDIKCELELQDKIDRLLTNPKYAGLPMLVMNSLEIRFGDGRKEVMVDISEEDYFFIFRGNNFIGNKKKND